ncbi:hypothetical protein F5Y18DRAFT_371327 [Xylariaceae sp. FL1019]|nr:hypothetical protein F5Y18DRAFT_371327 [Xylariaceae sp. FL1019]
MDPVSALSLASNILSVIDISSKVLLSAYKLYQSDNDTTEEAAHSGFIIEDLQKAAESIEIHHRGLTPHEQALSNLAKKTTDLSKDIIDTLSSGNIQGKKSFWRAFQASVTLSTKSSKLNSLTERARDCRSEIILRLNLMLVNQNSEIKHWIQGLDTQSCELQSQGRLELGQINEKLLEVLEAVQASETKNQATRSEYASSVREIRKLLESLKVATVSVTHRNMILRLLYFPSIHWREDTISNPASRTFEWITSAFLHMDSNRNPPGVQNATHTTQRGTYEEESVVEAMNSEEKSWERFCTDAAERRKYKEDIAAEALKRERASQIFKNFLTGENGIFFFTGKAGCGKSTLMKHISPSNNKYVRDALDHWASTRRRPLISIPMYFWISGNKLQRSVEGFYRTILFHFLRNQPDAMHDLFPDSAARFADEVLRDQPMRMSEILTAVSRMATTTIFDNHAFCIFVDGLDEYEGDKVEHLELARLLRGWAQHQNVKVICSARPYQEFIETFRDVATIIRLHDLTCADIALYAFDTLRNEQQLQASDSRIWSYEHDNLVMQIVKRSEGVFIWSITVVRFLSTLVGHSTTQALSALLDDTPKPMNELYKQILSRRKPMAQKKGNILLFVVCSLPDLKNAFSLSWLDEFKDPNFPMNQSPSFYPPVEVDRRLRALRTEFSDGTAGLLELRKEVSTNSNRTFWPFFGYRAFLIHRTARDFLKREWLPTVLPTICLPASIEDISRRMALAEVTFSVHSCYKRGYREIPWAERYPGLTKSYYAATCGSIYNRMSRSIDKLSFEECSEQSLMENQSFERLYSAYELLSDEEGLAKRPAAAALEMWFNCHEGVYSTSKMHEMHASFVHLALFRGQLDFVRERIAAEPSLVTKNDYNVSLLFTSLIRGYAEFAREIVRTGASFDDLLELNITLWPYEEPGNPKLETCSCTLWTILLIIITTSLCICVRHGDNGTNPSEFSSKISTIFKEMVRQEDADWNVGVVIESKTWGTPPEYIELVPFLELAPTSLIHPSDLGILRERVSRRKLPNYGNTVLWKIPRSAYTTFLSNWAATILRSTDSGEPGCENMLKTVYSSIKRDENG